MITTNIDTADGLSNGIVGTLEHIEYNEGRIVRVWLKFPDVKLVVISEQSTLLMP